MKSKIILYSALVVFGCVVSILCAEFGATAYYFIREGKYITPRERLAAEKNAYVIVAQAQTPTGSCAYGDSLIVHPFLAHVSTNQGPCGVGFVNNGAMIGKEFPDKAKPRVGVILITGGSVAAQFTWDNRNEDSPLEKILNKEFAGDRYQRFIVLNGGHGGWKQPNQYVLFGIYADTLAGVITLDGFNEHYMLEATRRFELPSNSFFQAVKRQDNRVISAPLRMAALKLDADLYRYAARHSLFRWSNFAYLLVDAARRKLRAYASASDKPSRRAEDDWVSSSYDRMFAFTEQMTNEERKQWMIGQYEKYIRLIHAGAQEMGVKSLFLIQPIPGLEKPLTKQEREFTKKTKSQLYKEMVDKLVKLRETRKIPVYSLLEIFRGEREQIYLDHIHVNQLGNKIMAREVANLIEKEWGWPRKPSRPETARN